MAREKIILHLPVLMASTFEAKKVDEDGNHPIYTRLSVPVGDSIHTSITGGDYTALEGAVDVSFELVSRNDRLSLYLAE